LAGLKTRASLQRRIGIATGLVVNGADGAENYKDGVQG
jgi:hypothetical protein